MKQQMKEGIFRKSWTGYKAKQELQQAGIFQEYFQILQECAAKAIKAALDASPGEAHLSGMSLVALEGLFSTLSYFFSGNGSNSNDYQLALQRYVKQDGCNDASGWTVSLSLWCLNPAVVFREIADLSLSVILTSGTLSPMSSFSSELGVQFDVCMEAPHVINTESQLWAAVIPSGPDNCQLNASYKTADSYAFQDSLGVTLEEICKNVPGGALVFFPSYKLLEKLQTRWCQTGQWLKLNAHKEIFIEPKRSTDEFELILRGYYDLISGKGKHIPGKIRTRPKRHGSEDVMLKQSPERGAAFLAVCRGKVSEGIDFSNDNARVVVIVGIPFPNKNDIQVMLKKKYNNTYKSSKNLLSGSDWYCHQAFRALNQAAGRCIRHRFDYGAIIFLDERYEEQRNLAYLSKWLRNSIKYCKNFNDSMKGLRTFFQDVKQQQDLNVGSLCNNLSDFNHIRQPFKASNLVDSSGDQKITKSSYPSSPGSTHDFSVIVDDDIKGGFHDSSSMMENSCSMPIRSSFTSSELYSSFSGAAISNQLGSCESLAGTPEKLSAGPPDAKEDSPFLSVNSYNQKKRSLDSSRMQCLNHCTVGSSVQSVASTTCNLSTENEKMDKKPFKLGNGNMPQSSNALHKEMKLHISCLACKNPLGLLEYKFLVRSIFLTLSKFFLSCTHENRTLDAMTKHHLKDPPASINVLCSDITFINKQILEVNSSRGFSQHGVWCEEDGCVFTATFCPFCTNPRTCLGARVLAADASNVHLLNRVLFYADRLYVEDGSKALNENFLPKTGYGVGKPYDPMKTENSDCKVIAESPYFHKQRPVGFQENDENFQPWPVKNENYSGEVLAKKLDYSSNKDKESTESKKNACNFQSSALEVKMTCNPPSFPARELHNVQATPVEIEKFAYFPQPTASQFRSSSKLKLKQRQSTAIFRE